MHAPLQVEERLRFYDDGVAPRKNATVMAEAISSFKDALGDADDDDGDAEMEDAAPAETPKAKKKSKKRLSVRCLPLLPPPAQGWLSRCAPPVPQLS